MESKELEETKIQKASKKIEAKAMKATITRSSTRKKAIIQVKRARKEQWKRGISNQ